MPETVFEDTDSALSWLQNTNASLGGVTPLSLLDTDIGADSVLDTLGRIEHRGVCLMRTVWRITTARFAQTAFSGDGARLYGGRWNPKGREVVPTPPNPSPWPCSN